MPNTSRRYRGQLRRGPVAILATTATFLALGAGAAFGATTSTTGATTSGADTATFDNNLSEALQKSLYFYDAEKSGPARSLGDQPLEWRGDSEPTDAKVPLKYASHDLNGTNLSESFIAKYKSILDPDGDGTVDLSGGFHDAGDHVKFGLPQSYAAATIEWAGIEFKDAFVKTHSWAHLLDESKWFTDYFLRSTFRDASGNVIAFNYMVGNGTIDHTYWGAPELQDGNKFPRPAMFATAETPASDQTSGAAAALVTEYFLVKDSDPTYAAKCLDTAKALYKFSLQYRGLGKDDGFYNSSFDEDELTWAAAWLYRATGDESYVNDIVSISADGTKYTGYLGRIMTNTTVTWQNIWVHSWDTKWGGAFLVLDPLIQNDTHVSDDIKAKIHYFAKWNIEFWAHVKHDDGGTDGIFWTAAGFAEVAGWGSARYTAAAAMQAVVYRKYFPDDPKSKLFTDWALDQLYYIMGDNPMGYSYIVGFGPKWASHPHHRAAHGSTTNSMLNPVDEKHTLWGALVGGPDGNDKHEDVVTNFVLNEVAIDYNAGLEGSLAGLWQYYGQDQDNVLWTPPLEPPSIEQYAQTKLEQENKERTQVTVAIHSDETRPPRWETKLSARYYFNISEMLAAGQSINDIKIETYYDEAKTIDPVGATISAPIAWDAANGIYYVEIKWYGVPISGKREYQFGIIDGQDPNYKTWWDPTNDWSREGVTDTMADNSHIPIYIDGVLISGETPPGGPAALGAASNVKVTGVTTTTVSLSWTASTDAKVTGYDIYRGPDRVGSITGTTFTDIGLTAGTSYQYSIRSHNNEGNISAKTTAITAKTSGGADADTTAPSAPTGLKSTAVSSTSVALSWTASTDNVGVTGYDIYRGSTKVGSATTTSYSDTGLTANTTYSYTVKAKDAAGNISSASSALSVKTSGTGTDTTPPSAPTGLVTGTLTDTSTQIKWTAATDNVGVTGYLIFKNGTQIASNSGALSYTATGLTTGTVYTFTVKAKDAAGNISDASSPLAVKTGGGTVDATPPSTPGNFHTLSVGSTAVRLSWTASTDNVGVTGYDIYKWTTRVDGTKSSLTITLTGLEPGRSYSFSVKAHDAAGNQSTAATLTVKTSSTSDTTPPSAPTGLKLVSSTATSVRLSWTAATDNVAVTAYDILANGSRVSGTAGSTSATITGLKAGTTYSFTVKAKDANNNISSASSALSVKTPSS